MDFVPPGETKQRAATLGSQKEKHSGALGEILATNDHDDYNTIRYERRSSHRQSG